SISPAGAPPPRHPGPNARRDLTARADQAPRRARPARRRPHRPGPYRPPRRCPARRPQGPPAAGGLPPARERLPALHHRPAHPAHLEPGRTRPTPLQDPGEHLRPTHRPRPRQGPLPHPRRALHRRQTCGQPPHRAPGRVHRNHLAPTRSPRLTPRQPTTTTVTGCHHTPETITQRAPAECLHGNVKPCDSLRES